MIVQRYIKTLRQVLLISRGMISLVQSYKTYSQDLFLHYTRFPYIDNQSI